jgi:UDP-N-acetylmuramate--alanine ligase
MHHSDHVVPAEPRPLPDGPLYFVGVGGAGMSSIAQVLAERGRRISGADPGISPAVKERLEAYGIRIYTRHDARNIEDAVAVVVSDAIPAANPEVQAAQAKGLPIFRRPEVLGSIVNAGRGIAIAGTHGKTTTTGMVASILLAAGLDPTILIGGDLPAIGGNARNGQSKFVVAESCEAYDGFLYLHPEVAVVLNIEADHLDYHGDEAHVIASFERFLQQTAARRRKTNKGDIILCWDDKLTRKVRGKSIETISTLYGIDSSPAVSVRAVDVTQGSQPSFRIWRAWYPQEEPIGPIRLNVPGEHNIRNALAAASVGLALNIAHEHIIAGLEAFTGTGRRFERLGEVNDVFIVDDYAHHPTEIRATLAAARSAYPERRLVAVFQPHLPSRTRDNMDTFADALTAADIVYVTDIYLAREQPIPGVSSEILADRIRSLRPDLEINYVPDRNELPARLAAEAQQGDFVLTMGAGDIRKAGEGLLAALQTGEK